MTRSRIVVKGTIVNNVNHADYQSSNGFFNQASYYDNNLKLRMSSVIEKGKITDSILETRN